MNIGDVLFNPHGRISPQAFLIGWIALLVANIVIGLVPIWHVSVIVQLVLIYVGVCVFGKRHHDAGRSAWWHVLPWVSSTLALGWGMMRAGPLMEMVMEAQASGEQLDEATLQAYGSEAAAFVSGFLAWLLIWSMYSLWVGMSPGTQGDNRFGPAPPANPG